MYTYVKHILYSVYKILYTMTKKRLTTFWFWVLLSHTNEICKSLIGMRLIEYRHQWWRRQPLKYISIRHTK